jgi:transcriptional regulator with XRE-family HTH domain
MDPAGLLQSLVDKKYGSQSSLARKLGISKSYMSDLLLGTRQPGPLVLHQLGLKRIVRYVRSGRSLV